MIMQFVFLLIPGRNVVIFGQFIRPTIYIVLVTCCILYLGRSRHHIRKAYQANVAAILAFILYAFMIIMLSWIFTGGRNAMIPSASAVIRNIWSLAIPLILGEYLRFRLIKGARGKHKIFIIVIISLTYAFLNLEELRILLFNPSPDILNFLFGSLLPSLTISVVVSFVALQGSFFSVALVSFIYNLGGSFSPFLPNIERLVWSLVVCMLAFVVGVIYYYIVDSGSSDRRKKTVRRAAGQKSKNPVVTGIWMFSTGLLVAFVLGFFPIYPIVVLTGSMTGTIDKYSMVVMRRIPEGEAFARVQIGDILHFNYRSLEVIHRVIDFSINEEGVREYITQGDANESRDPLPLAQEDVLGTPIFNIPFIGYPNVKWREFMSGGL